jgi:hypothetical protein
MRLRVALTAARAGLHDADHRDVERLLRGCEACSGARVAGDNDHLHSPMGQPRADLEHEVAHVFERAGAVRTSGGVSEVEDRFAREGAHHLPGDREAAESGVEHADGKVVHAGEYSGRPLAERRRRLTVERQWRAGTGFAARRA